MYCCSTTDLSVQYLQYESGQWTRVVDMDQCGLVDQYAPAECHCIISLHDGSGLRAPWPTAIVSVPPYERGLAARVTDHVTPTSHVTVTLRTSSWPPHAQAAAALRLAAAPGVRRPGAYRALRVQLASEWPEGTAALRHAGWCGDHYAMINDHDHQRHWQCHGHTGQSRAGLGGAAPAWASIRHHHDVRS